MALLSFLYVIQDWSHSYSCSVSCLTAVGKRCVVVLTSLLLRPTNEKRLLLTLHLAKGIDLLTFRYVAITLGFSLDIIVAYANRRR